MHLTFAIRGAPEEVDIWKKFMETQMFNFKQIPLEKDDKGNFIPDGEEEDGTKKFKHIKYPVDQVDFATGKVLHKKGEDIVITKQVQGCLRPLVMFEYVIPEEAYPEVIGMMDIESAVNAKMRPEVRAPFWAARKLMHLKPFPKLPELVGKKQHEITERFVPHGKIATYPVGVRKDKKQDFLFKLADGTSVGFYQEGL